MNIIDKFPVLEAQKFNNDPNNPALIYLFNSKTNKGFQVDGLAAVFVQRFDGSKNIQTLMNELENEFEIEKGKFNDDLLAFIQELMKFNLITLNEIDTSKV